MIAVGPSHRCSGWSTARAIRALPHAATQTLKHKELPTRTTILLILLNALLLNNFYNLYLEQAFSKLASHKKIVCNIKNISSTIASTLFQITSHPKLITLFYSSISFINLLLFIRVIMTFFM